jgi:hypothetical protein
MIAEAAFNQSPQTKFLCGARSADPHSAFANLPADRIQMKMALTISRPPIALHSAYVGTERAATSFPRR